VKSAKSIGVRAGNWLSLKQSQTLLNAPDISTLKGLRDRAMIAVLLGCALRRSEVAALTMAHVQQRDGRWCIVDLYGKHRRVRTIPMPAWVKVASLLATLFAAVAVGATRANVARQVRISSVRRYGSPRQLFVAHQPSAASRNCVQSRAIFFWASARSIFPFFTWAVRKFSTTSFCLKLRWRSVPSAGPHWGQMFSIVSAPPISSGAKWSNSQVWFCPELPLGCWIA
jgi:hypothetical protein